METQRVTNLIQIGDVIVCQRQYCYRCR